MARGSVTWEVRDGRAVWDGRLLADWVEPLARELALEFDAVEIVLFGSVARGDDNADSDVDLLVVLDRYDPADAAALKARAVAAARTPVPFDAAFTDPDRFASRSRIAGTLERAAATQGRVVHRRD